jgi:peroxiredoxin Q/BCP
VKLTFKEQKMTKWIESGAEAPTFTVACDDGQELSLADLRGTPVVLYFYPKDDTPGCTIEACAFRDRKDEIQELGVHVLGMSPDDVESHAKFRDKFELNFPLLADIGHSVAEQYGAWREKTRNGQTSMGVHRSTFLIDAAGKVAKVWQDVTVEGHDEEVLNAVRAL